MLKNYCDILFEIFRRHETEDVFKSFFVRSRKEECRSFYHYHENNKNINPKGLGEQAFFEMVAKMKEYEILILLLREVELEKVVLSCINPEKNQETIINIVGYLWKKKYEGMSKELYIRKYIHGD